ncbi:MAG: FdtA/QdtA family cupin domain-containing protein [Candidatus Moraniibacteriota bacterium]
MAEILRAKTFVDKRGSLTVIEKVVPFDIRRIFFIYGVSDDRGNHRHKRNRTALVCVSGSCKVKVNTGKSIGIYDLDEPEKILILGPEEFRTMYDFSPNAILLALVSEYYDPDDYIDEPQS